MSLAAGGLSLKEATETATKGRRRLRKVASSSPCFDDDASSTGAFGAHKADSAAAELLLRRTSALRGVCDRRASRLCNSLSRSIKPL